MKKLSISAKYGATFIVSLLFSSLTLAEQYGKNVDTFISEVERNPVTHQGYWLKTLNMLGQWEEVVLVFGYSDEEDYGVCQAMKSAMETFASNRAYRCHQVERQVQLPFMDNSSVIVAE